MTMRCKAALTFLNGIKERGGEFATEIANLAQSFPPELQAVPELAALVDFYGLAASFPADRLIVRSPTAKSLLLVAPEVLAVLKTDTAGALKVVNTGVKLFERETGKGATIVNSIVATARQCNLDKDVELPDDDADLSLLTIDERDAIVGKVYGKIMEIESRLLPCGLHTVGVPPTAEEAVATLVNIASIDRPEGNGLPEGQGGDETPISGLPRILAKSRGRDIEDVYRSSDAGVLADVRLAEEIKEGVRAAVKASVDRSTDANGRVTEVNEMMENLGAMFSGRHEVPQDDDGYVFIDRDGTHFRIILNFLRTGVLHVPESLQAANELAHELQYYQLDTCVEAGALSTTAAPSASFELVETIDDAWDKDKQAASSNCGPSHARAVQAKLKANPSCLRCHTLTRRSNRPAVASRAPSADGAISSAGWDRLHDHCLDQRSPEQAHKASAHPAAVQTAGPAHLSACTGCSCAATPFATHRSAPSLESL